MHACLAVTRHLHFCQNDRDLFRAIAVTWGWNGYRNKSQHRKLTQKERKKENISLRSYGDSNPRPFDHESGDLTTELSSLPSMTRMTEHVSISEQSIMRQLHSCNTFAWNNYLSKSEISGKTIQLLYLSRGWSLDRKSCFDSRTEQLSVSERSIIGEVVMMKWCLMSSDVG